jgi:hypothetical protein
LGKQKTNSPGANWDSGTLARRAKPKDGLCSGTRPRGETRIQNTVANGGLLVLHHASRRSNCTSEMKML